MISETQETRAAQYSAYSLGLADGVLAATEIAGALVNGGLWLQNDTFICLILSGIFFALGGYTITKIAQALKDLETN